MIYEEAEEKRRVSRATKDDNEEETLQHIKILLTKSSA